MTASLENKLKGLFWDLPPEIRKETIIKIINDPGHIFTNEQLLLRALSTLSWYELVELAGNRNILELLPEKVINRLFPMGRRRYYMNAKRLLSKYTVSISG
jgi:hypothetical protein